MASIHGIDILDNVKFFHRKFIVEGVVDLTAQYRNYGVAEEFANKKTISKDNKSFHHPLMVDSYDNNQLDSFFQSDSLTRNSLGQEGTSYWSIQKTGWIADRREPGYPRGASAEQIVDVFQMHRRRGKQVNNPRDKADHDKRDDGLHDRAQAAPGFGVFQDHASALM